MKIRRVGAQLFHADGQTDEANSRFSQFRAAPPKIFIFHVLVFTEVRISVLSEINLKKKSSGTLDETAQKLSQLRKSVTLTT